MLREADRFLDDVERAIAGAPRTTRRPRSPPRSRSSSPRPRTTRSSARSRRRAGDGLLALVTTQGAPLLGSATTPRRLSRRDLATAVRRGRAHAADCATRLAISHALSPAGPADVSAASIAALLGTYLNQQIASATTPTTRRALSPAPRLRSSGRWPRRQDAAVVRKCVFAARHRHPRLPARRPETKCPRVFVPASKEQACHSAHPTDIPQPSRAMNLDDEALAGAGLLANLEGDERVARIELCGNSWPPERICRRSNKPPPRTDSPCCPSSWRW